MERRFRICRDRKIGESKTYERWCTEYESQTFDP
jgi:hypothetical protein